MDSNAYLKLKPLNMPRPVLGNILTDVCGLFRVRSLCFLAVILCFVGLVFQQAAIAGVVVPPFPDSRFTMVDGVSLHYRESGSIAEVSRGSVLLVHGFAGSTFSWRFVTDTLVALGFHVVAIDLPPYGYSDKAPSLNHSFTARSQWIKMFLEQTFPERQWHVVGHSMGGGIIQALAIMYPDKILSATLVDGTLFAGLSEGDYSTPWVIRGGLRREMALMFIRPVLVNRWMVKRLLASAYGRSPGRDEVTGYLAPLKIRGTSRAILNAPVVSAELVEISVDSLKLPVLVVWGDMDKWVPAEAFMEVVERIAGAQMVYIRGAAHCPMETHPEEFNKQLIGFLLEVDAD
jgi:2-hydroxy-6-oxonona-2,4-dienedioate hydrolase